MADGIGHKILTQATLDSLPEWMQKMIASEKENLENIYCMYGDTYYANPAKIGPYIELPDGRLPMDPWEIRHFRKDAPGKDYYTCGYYDLMRYAFDYFAEKGIKAIQDNDIATFAKFMGSIGHVIEDCGTPPHAVGTELGTDLKLIKQLYPTADAKKMAGQFHTILESKFEPFILNYQPRLLGVTSSEISFNMLERFTDMIENSISFIIPILDAYYSDNEQLLAKTLSKCGKLSSEILADYIYTIISIGTNRVKENERKLLNSVTLSEFTPQERTAWAPFPYPYCEIRKAPWSMNKDFEPIDLSMIVDKKEKIFKKGFGIGPPFEMTYLLPKSIYKNCHSTIGINNKLGAESDIIFKILGDEKELTSAECSDVNGTKIITADISNITKLTLKIEAKNKNPNDIWPSNTHAIWGDPILEK